MRKQKALSVDVLQLNDIIVSHDPATTRLGDFLGRDDLPVVVSVIVGIAGDLLALRTDTAVIISQGISFIVRVEVLLRVLVTYGDSIVVSDFFIFPSRQIPHGAGEQEHLP